MASAFPVLDTESRSLVWMARANNSTKELIQVKKPIYVPEGLPGKNTILEIVFNTADFDNYTGIQFNVDGTTKPVDGTGFIDRFGKVNNKYWVKVAHGELADYGIHIVALSFAALHCDECNKYINAHDTKIVDGHWYPYCAEHEVLMTEGVYA